jgi:hypothetical protein
MDLHLRGFLRRVGWAKAPVILVALLLVPEAAYACPICFGNTESPLLDAARLGVLAMAGMTIGVLGVFGAWFIRLAKLESTASTQQDVEPRSPGSNQNSV